jgi:hypothetical protein
MCYKGRQAVPRLVARSLAASERHIIGYRVRDRRPKSALVREPMGRKFMGLLVSKELFQREGRCWGSMN